MQPANFQLPLIGSQVGKRSSSSCVVMKYIPVRAEGQDGEGVTQGGGGVTDTAHNFPDGILEVEDVPVLGVNVLLLVPLVHVDGVEIVHDLIPADGAHVSIETRAQLELVALEGQALPLGQGVNHLTIGSHIGDIKADGALHTVQVIIEAGGASCCAGRA